MLLISERYPHVLKGIHVRVTLPVIPWAMLRLTNEHSRAFRGRYSPETNPLGVEIVECQYWRHVRTVDVVGPPQWGKTFHACELSTLYDLLESRETVFYMNGSEDNARNIWTTRWRNSVRADPVLRGELLDRMDAGRFDERHFAGGGLLYSAGPESAAMLSQRESRIVRCSELEKTRAQLGNEASSYALARDRASAYPSTSIVVSDCTITVKHGIAWRRFLAGDRSRPFIPCPGCGRYACPAHARHLDEPALGLKGPDVHLLEIPELAAASPSAAEEQAVLRCTACKRVFANDEFRRACRAVVWVPLGCRVERIALSPIPPVPWLADLNHWAAEALADPGVISGEKNPPAPPAWEGPRLPAGVRLAWSPGDPAVPAPSDDAPAEEAAPVLPAFRPDPRQASARSFWAWRIFSPQHAIGQVAKEIVAGDLGELDDQKSMMQKCLVLPWEAPESAPGSDLDEETVLACVGDLPEGMAPLGTFAVTGGIDVGEDWIHYVQRAWTKDGESNLVIHGAEPTGLRDLRKEHGIAYNPKDRRFIATRGQAVLEALERVWQILSAGVPDQDGVLHPLNLAYVDSGHMSDEVYAWCGSKSWQRIRPVKGFGGAGSSRRRKTIRHRVGQWTDACEKKAAACRDARNRPMRHQYYDPKDPRHLTILNADHWKREVHNAMRVTAQVRQIEARGLIPAPAAKGAGAESQAPLKAWWFLHAKVTRQNRYTSQVVAERWEVWTDPRTGKTEEGWHEYQGANHLLDAEAYDLAAAAALGIDVGILSGQATRKAAQLLKRPRRPSQTSAGPGHDPSLG